MPHFLELFNLPFQELANMANSFKEKLHGKNVYWVRNRQINYTNVCRLHCSFCAFSKIKKDSPAAYNMGLNEILAKAKEAANLGAKELHIVGGLHPDNPFSYYTDMLKALKKKFPSANLKCFTAVEICHFAKQEKRSIESILTELKSAGLDTMPGGGAEILMPEIREQICGEKESGEEWLAVHRAAHNLGIPTNATMLFGHVESIEHRIEHLQMLRNLQSETGGFLAFLPLVFLPQNNALGRRVKTMASEEDILRTIAVSRLILDNVPHIKAYWVQLGMETALKALRCGASDLDGTVMEERISRSAGACFANEITAQRLQGLIGEQGLVPVERDALYATHA
ncbi:MAG: CofH family radical SAM protein [Fibromonadaceae bacterium]|jgi:aminodeoxyfutalosine synthase|nr:CofH family radical SAM protein [Fibromonadaceae bacterium]